MVQQYKNIIITTVFVFLCMGIYKYFPVIGNFQKIIASLVFFVALPILFDQLILKKKLSYYRLHPGHWKRGLILMGLSILIALIIILLLSKSSGFLDNYNIPKALADDFGYFVFYELVLVSFFTAIYEFFFRGFIMFHLAPVFRSWSVIAQAGLFLFLLLATAELGWNFVPYLVFAPFAGWIAYKSDSLFYSFAGQLIFIIIIDASIVSLIT